MAAPGEWSTERVAAALSRPDPDLLRRMSAGIAVLGPLEPRGSCVLVVDSPVVQRLTDLPRQQRLRFLGDLDLLAEAVHNVCRRRDPGFHCVDLDIAGGGGVLLARAQPRYSCASEAAPDAHREDLRTQLMDELDRICAAGRADYPTRHLYGRRPV